jgi:rubrerythrin
MQWICSICGKVMDSNEIPMACPMCGASSDYIVPEKDFAGIPTNHDQKTIENLNAALALETNATRDYFRYAKEARDSGDIHVADMFTALAKVESGHQVAIKKSLGLCK